MRGVSTSKSGVHAAIKNLSKGLYPGAFCKILPDVICGDAAFPEGDPNYCNVMHADGSGSKSALAYLAWKLTGDLRVWGDIVIDSLVMNMDDVACVGSSGPFIVSSTIGRNTFRVSDDVTSSLINGTEDLCQFFCAEGIACYSNGGETADLPDNVRNIDINHTVMTRFRRENVIDAGNIRPRSHIIGFGSTGQAKWETRPNSGIGANGLTNARHDVLHPDYKKESETYAPEMPSEFVYIGEHKLEDPLPGDPTFTIQSALLSPTRTYFPLIQLLKKELGSKRIQAFIHCSGGGQAKIGKFGPPGIKYVKDNPFPLEPLFKFLMETRKLPLHQMLKAYNCGWRLELITADAGAAKAAIELSQAVGIPARKVGETDLNKNPDERQVTIRTGEDSWETYGPSEL